LADVDEKFCPRAGNHLTEEKLIPSLWPIVLHASIIKSV